MPQLRHAVRNEFRDRAGVLDYYVLVRGVRERRGPRKRRPLAALRAQLTRGEIICLYAWMALSAVPPSVGLGLSIFGRQVARSIGVGLLVVALVLIPVPISPILRGRQRRRESRATRSRAAGT